MESAGSKLGIGDRGVGTVFKRCQHCIGQDDLRFRELELDGDGDLAEEDDVLVSIVDDNRPRNTEVLGHVEVEIELEDCWDEEVSRFPLMLHHHQPTHESVSQTASL
jgi:hypothetical protein